MNEKRRHIRTKKTSSGNSRKLKGAALIPPKPDFVQLFRELLIILSIGILMLVSGCTGGKSTSSPANPAWVDELIDEFEHAPVGNPPQSIWKFEYIGSTVYYVPPQCCDQYSRLYDASGTLICAPDGGFTGNGDGRCPDFVATRATGELIWSDARSLSR